MLEASIAYVTYAIPAEQIDRALKVLGDIPDRLIEPYDAAEIAYWRGRALESRDPLESLDVYLEVLNSESETHFRWFVQERLEVPAMDEEAAAAIARRERRIAREIEDGDFDEARALQTEIVRLAREDREAAIAKLEELYREVESFREVLELEPLDLPSFPLESEGEPGRGRILMAMGLFDEAWPAIPDIFPADSAATALTQAIAMRHAGRYRESVRAAEIVMKHVPDHYVMDLLPDQVLELLYPRYFYDEIVERANEHGADPRLLLSIMREESRFDPTAKSLAGARGLLQFVIMTAMDIGEEIGMTDLTSDHLYEPSVVIPLGSRYVANLMEEVGGNRYATAAAYNAGPNQAALWLRLTPAPGDDYFLSSITFDETRNYVRKVMNSYRVYGWLYDEEE